MDIPPRRKVTTACSFCKMRRIKCNGQQPCSQCVANYIDCTFAGATDHRRTGDLKRKLADLEEDHDLLRRLLRTLRHQNSYVDELVGFIRDQRPSLAQIKSFMDGTISHNNGVLDVNRLCDTPLFYVPARPWTNITHEDYSISHLISLWFTWHYSLFDWVDQELSLRDMKSGLVGSTFCSPFLANAILAEACAKRLLDDEEGSLTIATVYGMGVMYSWLGWVYLVWASNAFRMFQSRQHEILAGVDLPKERLNLVMAKLELGIFGVVTMTSNVFLKPPQLDKPKVRLPVHLGGSSDVWIPYPRQTDANPAHKNCVVNERTRLGIIVWDITRYIAEEQKPPISDMESAVHEWHQRLLDWVSELPPCVAETDQSIPAVLDLHMYYHTILMTIYAYLKTPPRGADEATVKSAAAAREICIASAHAVSNSVSIHEAQWGVSRMTAANMHFLSVALQMLVDDIENETSHQAFLTLCRASIPLTQRFPTLKGMFRLKYPLFRRSRQRPRMSLLSLKTFERRLWKPEDRKQYSSLYPHFATAIKMKEAETSKQRKEVTRP
ncbi:hypothetical protein BDW66DRAFT_162432 [Aspergillus desertorum]